MTETSEELTEREFKHKVKDWSWELHYIHDKLLDMVADVNSMEKDLVTNLLRECPRCRSENTMDAADPEFPFEEAEAFSVAVCKDCGCVWELNMGTKLLTWPVEKEDASDGS